MQAEQLRDLVTAALHDMKGVEVRVLDVRSMTPLMDFMVVVSGTSDRHVKSLARHVQDQARAAGIKPMGVEGEQQGEWVLVDLRDVVVHVMRPQVRDFYNLEKLWSVEVPTEQNSSARVASRQAR